jgi:hypothetical protein
MESARLVAQLEQLYPQSRVLSIDPLGPDRARQSDPMAKIAGYGAPIHIRLGEPDGAVRELVFRVATSNELGHDRRAARAAETLQAFDDFAAIPRNVEPLAIGASAPMAA